MKKTSNSSEELELSLFKIPGISKLVLTDGLWFDKMFSNERCQYMQSFLYLLRASHGNLGELGYKYVDDKLVVIIGYRYGKLYITPLFDKTYGVLLEVLCSQLYKELKCRIIIKKFDENKYPQIKSIADSQLSDSEKEDDAYPESLIELSTLFVTETGDLSRKAKRFLQKVKRFDRLNIKLNIIDDLTKIPQAKIEKFIAMDERKYANYLPMVKYLFKNGITHKYKILVYEHNNTIHGLYIAEIISHKALGLYCAVNSKENPGSTEWMDWYFFRKMFFEGKKVIYFGGAENKGVDYYIQKLLPEKPTYVVKAVEYQN